MQERNAVDRMTSQDGIPLRMQWLVPVFHFPFGFHSFRYMIFISITGIAGKCTTPSFEALTLQQKQFFLLGHRWFSFHFDTVIIPFFRSFFHYKHLIGSLKNADFSRDSELFTVTIPTLKNRSSPRSFLRDDVLFPAQSLTLAEAIPPVGRRSVLLHPEYGAIGISYHLTAF